MFHLSVCLIFPSLSGPDFTSLLPDICLMTLMVSHYLIEFHPFHPVPVVFSASPARDTKSVYLSVIVTKVHGYPIGCVRIPHLSRCFNFTCGVFVINDSNPSVFLSFCVLN